MADLWAKASQDISDFPRELHGKIDRAHSERVNNNLCDNSGESITIP